MPMWDATDGRDDAAVLACILAGDTQRFAELVGRYQAGLYRYAVSMVLDHDVAADMVQDAFIRVYTSLASCRDRTRFRAWLFRTLRNRCLDHLKEPRRRHVPLEEAASVVDAAAGPGETVEHRRVRTEILGALAQLPDVQREAFVMHYVEGEPYARMAERLDASVSALKMRVMRAREALAALLQRPDVTEPVAARLSIRRS